MVVAVGPTDYNTIVTFKQVHDDARFGVDNTTLFVACFLQSTGKISSATEEYLRIIEHKKQRNHPYGLQC